MRSADRRSFKSAWELSAVSLAYFCSDGKLTSDSRGKRGQYSMISIASGYSVEDYRDMG